MPDQVLSSFEVAPDIEPKGSKQIEYDGGAQCKEADVDEIHSYPAGGQPHLIRQVTTNPEGRAFHELSKLLHRLSVLDKIRLSNSNIAILLNGTVCFWA